MKRIFLLGLSVLFFSACERIPEWERKGVSTKNADDSKRLAEFKHWIWTCRANSPTSNSEKAGTWLGQAVENYLEYFRAKGLSSLETTGPKTIFGTALLWKENGYLVSSFNELDKLHDIDCSNGTSGWLPAEVKGQDRTLDLILLKIDTVQNARQKLKDENHWLVRSEALEADENLSLLSSAVPGELENLQVTIQPFPALLGTGIDRDLLFFLPAPTVVSNGGVLVDKRWKAVGYLLPHPSPLWGAAVTMKRLEVSVDSLMTKGKVLRPYAGFRIRFVPSLGFVVQQIEIGSPAYQAGLRVQDAIVRWDDRDLADLADWKELQVEDAGRPIAVSYKRGNKVIETRLTPAAVE